MNKNNKNHECYKTYEAVTELLKQPEHVEYMTDVAALLPAEIIAICVTHLGEDKEQTIQRYIEGLRCAVDLMIEDKEGQKNGRAD